MLFIAMLALPFHDENLTIEKPLGYALPEGDIGVPACSISQLLNKSAIVKTDTRDISG